MNAYSADVKNKPLGKHNERPDQKMTPSHNPPAPVILYNFLHHPRVPCTFINSSDVTFAYLTFRT